jgi:cytochrome c-type biogenesis protein CcmE
MNKRKIGLIIMIFAIFIMGIGIGLKLNNSEMNTNLFIIVGLILNGIGLLIIVTDKKKRISNLKINF